MNILIIGNGGREHAFAWKIRQSPLCGKLYVAPGNAGSSLVAENISIGTDDFEGLGKFCVEKEVGLVVVGPEAPLVNGVRDYFESRPELKKILFVGPGASGARLEGSKDFSKQFMMRHNIPTAKARSFTASDLEEARNHLATLSPPVVLKADGLAAGKGVVICESIDEAISEIQDMLVSKKFGEASATVLVEEFLKGIELSVFVLTDGKDYVVLPEAKDYKRIGEGDTGPNTGGMGAVSPVVFAGKAFMQKVEQAIIKPTIAGLNAEGIPYCGFIFIGLMNVDGSPFVIEYNARMGDPETQAVLPRIKNDFADILIRAAKGELAGGRIEIEEECAVTLSLVAGGYPGNYSRGKVISGLPQNGKTLVFHAGTKKDHDAVVTDGGRVLAVTARGRTLEEARNNAYETASGISWDQLYYRKDIGLDLLKYKG